MAIHCSSAGALEPGLRGAHLKALWGAAYGRPLPARSCTRPLAV